MSKGILCIVGRPNVGKSTLFNRIVGKKISITEDQPGVTRDRIYAEGEWLGNFFTVIDTGGLDPEQDDTIMSNIRSQAQIAIETADVILFVTDGMEGLTSTDREIASILRRSGNEVVLAANKIDNPTEVTDIYDFYELGFGEPMMISSEQGTGIGDLLDEVVKYFPNKKTESDEDDLIKVSLIGKPNVGKSSLINTILGEDRVIVTDIPGTTRDAIDSYFDYDDNEYVFIDTAGLRRKRSVNENIERYSVIRTLTAVDRSDICILVIDALEGITEQDTKIAGYAHDNGKAIVIAVNKWDLIDKDNLTVRQFEKDIRTTLSFMIYAPMIFVSALTGERIPKLMDLLKLANNNYNLRVRTGVLNDVINQAVLMNQPGSDKGKRGKIYYGTQVATRPPTFVIFVNDKKLMHFSYKRYLENQIRINFGFEGTPIKLEFRQKDN